MHRRRPFRAAVSVIHSACNVVACSYVTFRLRLQTDFGIPPWITASTGSPPPTAPTRSARRRAYADVLRVNPSPGFRSICTTRARIQIRVAQLVRRAAAAPALRPAAPTSQAPSTCADTRPRRSPSRTGTRTPSRTVTRRSRTSRRRSRSGTSSDPATTSTHSGPSAPSNFNGIDAICCAFNCTHRFATHTFSANAAPPGIHAGRATTPAPTRTPG